MNRFIIIELLIFLSNIALSQEYQYVPFPDSGVIWSEAYNPATNEHNISSGLIYERFALNGEDTIINEISYKKLYIFYDTIFTESSAWFVGGIREDSLKKIYFKGDSVIHYLKPSTRNIKENGEILLYDFSLSVGDTLRNINQTLSDQIITVRSIDTVNIANTLRKKFSFEPIGWVHWIEGIGSLKGLLFTSGSLPTNGLNNDLICFKQNNEILYFNNNYSNCIPKINHLKPEIAYSEMIVSPNPCMNGLLTFHFNGLDISELKIFNCDGKCIDTQIIDNQSEFIIDVDRYLPDIYLYKAIHHSGNTSTGKFIIK